MSDFFTFFGVIAFVVLIGGALAGVGGKRSGERRPPVGWEAEAAAYRIHEHTRRAVEEMLDEARRQRGER